MTKRPGAVSGAGFPACASTTELRTYSAGPLRGEIWQLNLDPTVRAEMRKLRPAVIVSGDAIGILPLRVIVPFTSWRPEFADTPWLVRVEPSARNGLTRTSAADAFQIKSVSVRRFVSRLGTLSGAELEAVVGAVAAVIEHP